MINDTIYSKLTPSAKEALDELSEDYKEALLDKAYRIANERDTANREISLRDIIEASQKPERVSSISQSQEIRRRRYLTIISFSGIIYATSGFIIYLYQNNKFSLDKDFGLVIAIVGLLITLFAGFYAQLLSRRYAYKESKGVHGDSFDIVKRWQIIETQAKKLMSESDKKESSSVSFLIRFLSHKVAKDEREFSKIKELLQLRNKIVHEQYEPRINERQEYLMFADELIKRLEEALTGNRDINTIKVLAAVYGTKKNSIDITKELNQLIANNKLEFVVSNDIAGDPDYGTVKDFKITYELNGRKETKEFKEGDKVSIPSLE